MAVSVKAVSLNPEMRSPRTEAFEQQLFDRIVGQDEAVRHVARFYQIFQAKLSQRGRPVGILLFLGPTGSGKTRIVEAAAEVLYQSPNAMIKIDCAEYQQGHEIAKLIGSPPGYLGHSETAPLLTQENLNRFHTPENKLTLLLFDEIEKSSDTLWQLLLGIFDKATLTLGTNQRVDFSRCLIFLTSNLGAREMSEFVSKGIGFCSDTAKAMSPENLQQKMRSTAVHSAARKFTPEFMNRIDQTVVFRPLQQKELRDILEIELRSLQTRIYQSGGCKFAFRCTDGAKQLLLTDGLDLRYGARHLKRSIERHLVLPFANLIASNQITDDDSLVVDNDADRQLVFRKESPGAAYRRRERVGYDLFYRGLAL
jgi:ATP-dependent Clp protease ATP-binding subunit ClpB